MKRRFTRLSALFCLAGILLSSCGGTSRSSAKIPAGSGQKVSAAEVELPSEYFIQSLTAFTVDTAAAVLPEGSDSTNRLYSPSSLYLALAMLADTANGDTQAQILDLLGAEDVEELRMEASNWYRSLCHEGSDNTLAVAGSLWLNEEIPFRQEPLDRLADSYGAYAYQTDFSSASLPKEIAAWVREATHGLLGDAADFQPEKDSALFLFSTLYFKGAWSNPFSKELTKEADFTRADGSTVTVEFMEQKAQSGYVDGENFAASFLPMQNGATMVLVLPDEGVSPAEVAADPEALTAAFFPEETEYGKVNFRVPKFDYSVSLEDLPEVLQTLGMTDAFDDVLADFSPLSEYPLFVSNIRQEATLSIDEEGCEGAAYTEVSMNTSAAMPPEQEFTLNLDRPFLYAVQYRDTILFTGIVNDPTCK